MPTAWPSDEIGSYLSGDDAKAAFPEAVYDRAKVAMRMGATVDLESVTSGTSTAWVSAASTFDVFVPRCARSGETLRFYFDLSSVGTAYGRVRETGVPTNGTEATGSGRQYSDVTIAAGWPGTLKTFDLQARGDGVDATTADGGQIVGNVKVVD